jgi:hypothetical protein
MDEKNYNSYNVTETFGNNPDVLQDNLYLDTNQLPVKVRKNIETSCDNFIAHISHCKKCYEKMKNQFRPHLIENFQEMIDTNRDTIVLILIGISILLFINLINNITRH